MGKFFDICTNKGLSLICAYLRGIGFSHNPGSPYGKNIELSEGCGKIINITESGVDARISIYFDPGFKKVTINKWVPENGSTFKTELDIPQSIIEQNDGEKLLKWIDEKCESWI